MNPPARTPAYPHSTVSGPTDADLIRRAASGDEDALGKLYDRWAGVVAAMVRRVVPDPDEVEDVVEEIFWQVWRQAARYEPSRGSVHTWILTIARTRAIDRLRAARRRNEESLDDVGDGESGVAMLAADASADPSTRVEHGERRRIVAAALAELPAEQRGVIELAYYRGLSQSEIAAKTGDPVGTVKTRMRLAMRKLRTALAVLREEGT